MRISAIANTRVSPWKTYLRATFSLGSFIRPLLRDRGTNARMLSHGEFRGAEARLPRTDGQYRWVLIRLNPLRDKKGRIIRWYGTRTDLKRPEETLRSSEAYLAESQRLSRTGTFGWDVSSGNIFCSERTFRILGYDKSVCATVERRVLQRAHPEDLALVQRANDRTTSKGNDFDFEHRLLMQDGSVKYVRVLANAARNESDNLEYIGAGMDVTEKKLAQIERERLGQQLRQAANLEAVRRLAGGIAHDFNNVLAGIFAYGEMLVEETPSGSPLRRYAQNVLTAATRGRELVEQILAFSRGQRGKRAPVDLANVVAETLELLRGSLPPDIRLEASVPELALVVIGDATALHEVVMNLCSNAIQAMSGGGTLRVVLEAADLSDARVLLHGTLGPGRYVRLTIEDSGSGMDEATLSRIFEPFFTTKEIGRGTGLGLALVYAIVTDLGGAIDVTSAPHQGSTFTIYLPHSELALAAADAAAASPPRGNGERVLLVDDETPVLAATAEVLSRLGYEVVSFSDSRAALAAFEAAPGRFDVVVIDQAMPGLTGTGLASVLHRHRPDLPTVILSGYSGPLLTQEALAAGVSEVLTKPLQSREMATTLARVLHRTA